MKNKKITLAFLALLLISSVSATAFGSFQYSENEKTAGEPVEYRLGLINLGNSPLKVEFSSESGAVSLNYREEITLKPSNISETPGDGKWYYLGNGSYAQVRVYSFDAAARKFRNKSFEMTLRAYSEQDNSDSGFQNIIQERSYSFTLINSTYEEGLIDFTEGGQKSSKRTGENASNVTINQEEETVNSSENQNKDETDQDKSQGLNPLLIAGVLVSMAYLGKVMLL